jgi:quinol monooxygenase YgiN
MIILSCVCVPHPGKQRECIEAAQALMDGARGHWGLVNYTWAIDPDDGSIFGLEVQESEESMLNHLGLNDFSRMAAASSLVDIRYYGPTPSPTLKAVLDSFGEYKAFLTI